MADKFAQVGARIEAVLDELASRGDPSISERAEELVSLLVELYGGGLERMLEIIGDEGEASDAILRRLSQDELVQALLLVHGLHPVDLDQRINEALESVRPYMGSHSGGVENLGVDQNGVLHLRLEGNCEGCPSSRVTVQSAIEDAVHKAAPELAGLDVQGVVEEARPAGNLLQIGGLHGQDAPPAAAPGHEWASVTRPELAPGQLRSLDVEGLTVLLCSVEDDIYAYRNACAACGALLDEGRLEDEALTCATCGHSYNVRLAGRSLHGESVHLQPLPLLQQNGSLRIAMTAVAR
jgi:Fe-S cluster biogenesis protein NfuA/nitrite reductase/ring-hydroxylating ferredoxin subunit